MGVVKSKSARVLELGYWWWAETRRFGALRVGVVCASRWVDVHRVGERGSLLWRWEWWE